MEVLAAPGCGISGLHIRAVEPLRLHGELPGSLVSIDSFVVELSFVSFAMLGAADFSEASFLSAVMTLTITKTA